MKKIITLLLMALTAGTLSLGAQQAYDQARVVQGMRESVARLGTLRTALNGADWKTAAQTFWAFAVEAETMSALPPPKGSEAVWDEIWGEFYFASLKGVGAAGEKDAAKGLAALDALTALSRRGHGTFR